MEFKLEQILESGNVNELRRDEHYINTTPLINYTLNQDIKSVIKLIKHGANPNISDDWGMTPLEVASKILNYEISKVLLKAGANTNYRNCIGQTPFMHLLNSTGTYINKKYINESITYENNHDYNFITLFLKNGANTYIKDDEGHDSLDYATFYHQNREIQKLIIRWRAALIIQYNIKAKLFRNRIKKRIETKKLLLTETILPMDLIKIVKNYV